MTRRPTAPFECVRMPGRRQSDRENQQIEGGAHPRIQMAPRQIDPSDPNEKKRVHCGAFGFVGCKTITPKTAAQKQKLQNLPPGKIAMIKKAGKTYYVYPDAPNNQAYVGGPAEYQAYQQQRAANKLAEENLETAEIYQDEAMNWGAWGGW